MGLVATTLSPLLGTAPRLVDYFNRKRWLRALAITCASALSFAILMKLTLVLLFGNGIAVCWPLVGLVSAVMLRLPRRHWPWILLGIACGHVYAEPGLRFDEMLVNTICDISEVVIVVFALPPFTNLSDWIREHNLMARLIAYPVVLGPILSAIPVGIVFSRAMHVGFWKEARQWCLADALGVVMWLPLGLVLLSPETYELFKWRALPRTAGLVGLTALISLSLFRYTSLPVAFVIMPVLLMVALKLGFSAAVLSVNMLSLITAVTTLHGTGPFGLVDTQYRVNVLQVFLAMCMLSCFPISIIMMERDALVRELRQACEGMAELATKDGLTGLANRRRFDTVLLAEWSRAAREGSEIGLLMIDVDCFKLYNDRYGHVAGDQCLRRIAETLATGAFRAGDLVGRYGGEEFFVLMPRTDTAGLLKVGERIRQAVEAIGIEHERNPHHVVTISLGCCSTIPQMQVSPESLVEWADKALYAAKQGGRNRVEANTAFEEELAQVLSAAGG